ncbi:MAG: TlpA family protein disulfide reductase, partial [Planctomycetes bacterium]|nr:TlpA family protein disulfide reductase [Planctomycetota bacterium]
LDFWATWCAPCIRTLPHMKSTYAAYKNKDVEFVGISLDHPGKRKVLIDFVKDRGMNWIHTYSGKGWRDPTATRYGVRSIPSIWVLGKDGRVVSNNARANLRETIEQALAAKPDKDKTDKGVKSKK